MKSGKLTAKQAATNKPGRYGDGGGLWLSVAESGSARWLYRFTISGRVSEMGLGARDVVSLAEARDKASEARKLAKSGVSPVEQKREALKALKAAAAKPTFGEIADALIAAKQSEWRNARHRQQWRVTLTEFAAPLYPLPVDQVDTAPILAVLTPLWATKRETASRLRGRIEAVLDAAKAKGHRSGENPAAWRGHLAHLLPKRDLLSRGHHAAMPYANAPIFIEKLRAIDSVAALALEFTILTAARSGEVFGARWSEIDMDSRVWTVPAARMKAAREHRVPLSSRALAILEKLSLARTDEFVFPGAIKGRPVSATAVRNCLNATADGATIHGFRSSFRDWVGNETHFPREIAEAALAHVVGGAVEQAYRRSDALEKRRALMTAWENFLGDPAAASNVVRLR
ncbi:MAG: integrase arm-type DNA-binding domain-containing protein [Methylocystis sp.]